MLVDYIILKLFCRPHKSFHLVPSVRRRSPNGHHVTFTADGILKEFKSINAQVFEYIRLVYEAKLLNVEWGRICGEKSILIMRLGVQLRTALANGSTTREVAIASVRAGLDQLHQLGLAHCDVKVGNVFVDFNGVVFLDDIEYLTPVHSSLQHWK